MRKGLICILFIMSCCQLLAAERSNIVLFYADDLGYGDLSCYGATKLKTPNIDRLADEGRMFTDAHTVSSVCTPSRYGLLTGEYPFRKGIYGPAVVTTRLLIDTRKLTIASLLKKSGYDTACIGKWHLGFGTVETDYAKPLRPGPLELGFDYYYGVPVVNSAPPYVYVENDRVVGMTADDPLVFVGRDSGKNVTPLTPLLTDWKDRVENQFTGAAAAHKLYDDYAVGTKLAERACAWIKERRDNPFFLYFATTNIHHPFTPAKRFQGTSECGLYGDFVHELDWMVGEVMKALEDTGAADNTLIIFTSDNGGMLNFGGQGAFKKGHKVNGDLLGFKFGSWEGGHRVPFIVKWPGKVKPGTTSGQLISSLDMLATFAAIVGQNVESQQMADSINVLPAFVTDSPEPLRKDFIAAAYSEEHVAVRKGKWLYIGAQGSGGFKKKVLGDPVIGSVIAASFVGSVNSDFENGKYKKNAPPAQLYDLEADVNQTTNLYNKFPAKVKEMKAFLAETRKAMKPKTRMKIRKQGKTPGIGRSAKGKSAGKKPGKTRNKR